LVIFDGFDDAALNPNGPPMDEGGGRLTSSLSKDASRRGSRYVHHLSNLFVGKAFQVRQAQGLEFVESQGHLFEQAHGHSGGLEMEHFGVVAYGAWFRWSGQ